jgi:hypothetical protein
MTILLLRHEGRLKVEDDRVWLMTRITGFASCLPAVQEGTGTSGSQVRKPLTLMACQRRLRERQISEL